MFAAAAKSAPYISREQLRHWKNIIQTQALIQDGVREWLSLYDIAQMTTWSPVWWPKLLASVQGSLGNDTSLKINQHQLENKPEYTSIEIYRKNYNLQPPTTSPQHWHCTSSDTLPSSGTNLKRAQSLTNTAKFLCTLSQRLFNMFFNITVVGVESEEMIFS